jgi:hypothetical protein
MAADFHALLTPEKLRARAALDAVERALGETELDWRLAEIGRWAPSGAPKCPADGSGAARPR